MSDCLSSEGASRIRQLDLCIRPLHRTRLSPSILLSPWLCSSCSWLQEDKRSSTKISYSQLSSRAPPSLQTAETVSYCCPSLCCLPSSLHWVFFSLLPSSAESHLPPELHTCLMSFSPSQIVHLSLYLPNLPPILLLSSKLGFRRLTFPAFFLSLSLLSQVGGNHSSFPSLLAPVSQFLHSSVPPFCLFLLFPHNFHLILPIHPNYSAFFSKHHNTVSFLHPLEELLFLLQFFSQVSVRRGFTFSQPVESGLLADQSPQL